MAHSSNHKTKRLGDGSLLTEDPDQGLGHVLNTSVYLKTFAALIFLTVLTVLAAEVHLGEPFNIIVAIAIASVKATVVACFFMHLKFEGKWIILYSIYPLVVLGLLIGFTVFDNYGRDTIEPKIDYFSTPQTSAQKATVPQPSH